MVEYKYILIEINVVGSIQKKLHDNIACLRKAFWSFISIHMYIY